MRGTGWETFVRRRHMQLVTRSGCSALSFSQSLFEPVLTLCSEFSLVSESLFERVLTLCSEVSLVTRQRWHI